MGIISVAFDGWELADVLFAFCLAEEGLGSEELGHEGIGPPLPDFAGDDGFELPRLEAITQAVPDQGMVGLDVAVGLAGLRVEPFEDFPGGVSLAGFGSRFGRRL